MKKCTLLFSCLHPCISSPTRHKEQVVQPEGEAALETDADGHASGRVGNVL